MKNVRTIPILFFLLFSLTPLQGQKGWSVGARAGMNIWGTGDLWVPTLEIEARTPNLFIFDLGLSTGVGHRSTEFETRQNSFGSRVHTSFFTDLTLGMTAFQNQEVSFSFQAGPSLRYFDQKTLLPPEQLLSSFFEENRINSSGFIVGIIIRPELIIRIIHGYHITLAASTTPYQQGEISSGFSISLKKEF